MNKSPVARRGAHARGRAHSRAALHHARHAGGRGGRSSPLRARRAGVHRGARGTHPVGDDDTQDRDRHGGRRKRHPEDGRHAHAPTHPPVSQPPAPRRPRSVAWQHQARTSHARYTAASAQRAASRPRAAVQTPPRMRRPRPFLSRHEESLKFVTCLEGKGGRTGTVQVALAPWLELRSAPTLRSDAAQARPRGEEGGESGE